MFKAISITLPEKMIQEVDVMLLEKDFASRSDLFRHLIRIWLLDFKRMDSKVLVTENPKDEFASVVHYMELRRFIKRKLF